MGVAPQSPGLPKEVRLPWVGRRFRINPVRVAAVLFAAALTLFTSAAIAQPQQSDTWLTAERYETFHVVLPENAPEELQYAAEIFIRYWKICTNREIKATPLNEGVTNVWLGPDGITSDLLNPEDLEELGPEGYLIRTYFPSRRYRERGAREQLIISGKTPRGTLNGVFAFFRDHLGLRWLAPGKVHAPLLGYRMRHIDETYRPHFSIRESGYFDIFAQDTAIAKADLLEYRRAHGFPDTVTPVDPAAYTPVSAACCALSTPYVDSDHAPTRTFVNRVLAAAGQGARVLVTDYVENMLDPGFPFPALHALQRNLQWYDQFRISGVRIETHSNPDWQRALRPLQAYVTHSLLWDPDRAVDVLTDDFVDLYYGDAADTVREAIRRLEKAAAQPGNTLEVLRVPAWATKAVILGDAAEATPAQPKSAAKTVKLSPTGPVFSAVEGANRDDYLQHPLKTHCPPGE